MRTTRLNSLVLMVVAMVTGCTWEGDSVGGATAVTASSVLVATTEPFPDLPEFSDEETWPGVPVVDEWYRLNFADYAFCGGYGLYVPSDPEGVIHHNELAHKEFRGKHLVPLPDGSLKGFARLREDGSVDFTPDGGHTIMNYPSMLRSEIEPRVC